MTTATSIARSVRRAEISARSVTDMALRRIADVNPVVNAVVDTLADRARARADRLDAVVAAGQDPGPLAGVPFAVKNLIDVAGLPTRAGSKINRERAAAGRDGALVRRLEAAGAVLVGTLAMGEYAYDFSGRNAHYGACRNPHDPKRMTGGSSSGSGAAVAAGMVPLALGSDTNGSIRVPSALCGCFGLKPTYGRLSRAGSFMFVASLDHLGPLARSAADLAAAYDAMQGPDADDPACTTRTVEPVSGLLARGAEGLRIAVADGYFARGADDDALGAVTRVAGALGATARIEIPEAARARAAAFLITATEGANLHLGRLKARAADFDPETRDRLLAGALTPAAWYVQAQRFRRWYQEEVRRLFDQVDIILAPATPCVAPEVDQQTMVIDGQTVPVRASLGIFTQPISFVGLPVVAVPLKAAGGMPVGVQVIAAPWAEDKALRVAAELEARGICAAPVAEIAHA
jgi:aspartyl-tRNA(Asn)/glutamyl-tRNA(Gln) amidotransferase subunit A